MLFGIGVGVGFGGRRDCVGGVGAWGGGFDAVEAWF